MDQGEACQGPTGNITQYQLTFQTGSVVATESVNIARCTAGRCSHTFEPPSNPPSSYDSVSVAAENVVGVGAARTCTTQPISELSCHSLDTDWSTWSSHAKHLLCTSRLCVVMIYQVLWCCYTYVQAVKCIVQCTSKNWACKHMYCKLSKYTPPFFHTTLREKWREAFVGIFLHFSQLILVRLTITMIAIAFWKNSNFADSECALQEISNHWCWC